MKQLRYWLCFDLGFRGNYEDLYEWLDRHEAQECGDGVATFLSDKTRESIIKELSELLSDDKKSRLYLINRDRGGRFIVGRRKAPPWAGYASKEVAVQEET